MRTLEPTHDHSHSGWPRLLRLGSVAFLASLTPIAVARSGATDHPFLFTAVWHLAGGLTVLAYLVFHYHALFTLPLLREILRPRWQRHSESPHDRLAGSATVLIVIAALIFGHLDLLFLVWSIRLSDVAVATILHEIWPFVVSAVAMVPIFASRAGPEAPTRRLAELSMLIGGLAFVTLSHLGTHARVVGIILGIMSSLAWGIQYEVLRRWMSMLAFQASQYTSVDRREIELFGFLLISACFTLVNSVILGSVALIIGERLLSYSLLYAVVLSVVIALVVRPAIRRAASETPQEWTDTVLLSIPFAAFLWLLITSQIGAQYLDRLLIGAVAVLTATFLIHFPVERRLGFRSLIMSVWVFGTAVYFRGDAAAVVGLRDWSWSGGEYLTAVGLSATVFTLIFSFRLGRIMARTSDEANRAVSLLNLVDYLVSRGVISRSTRQHLLVIDAHGDQEQLEAAYRSARKQLTEPYTEVRTQQDSIDLRIAVTELDALAHSRQAGRDFGEFIALSVFAVMTVALALFSLEGSASCWGGFLIEMFTVLFCAVIVFLVINVWDLERERAMPVLSQDGSGVMFRERPRPFQQKISIGIVFVMMGTYGWLLTDKWLGVQMLC